IEVVQTKRSIILSGVMDNWKEIVAVGYLFVNKRSKRHVVNNIKLQGRAIKKLPIFPQDDSLEGASYDVIIIGGGIIGTTILRELSRYELKTLLIEKEADLACGASGANDGMIHPGIDLSKNSLKAKYCLAGNQMYEVLSKELNFPFQRTGQYIIFASKKDSILATYLLFKAKELNIPGVKKISKAEIIKIEPEVKSWAKGAVEIKCSGITSPYQAVYAFAENAVLNGADVCLETVCLGFNLKKDEITEVLTNRGAIKARVVINAAGVFADEIAEFANDKYFSIHPRKGTDVIFDSKVKPLVNTIISRFPKVTKRSAHSKGGGIISTVDGNVLIGPDAEEVEDKYDLATSAASLERVFQKHHQVLPKLKKSEIIAYFSGLRAATYEEDFIIEKSEKVKNLIHVAGIQSPGLTAAPAIALDVSKMALSLFSEEVKIKPDFNPLRNGLKRVKDLEASKRNDLIKQNPDYGKIICRCEEVSLGEIKEAIKALIPATSIDAIKRRVRPGMGRCQGGFCTPLLIRILSEELKIDILEVKKRGINSNLSVFKTKRSEGKDEI
ncbi:MAG: NAD(P)/FAD-dependent oxidoreductase, partial [Bacilli bacterium]|nr:NAD(P)/FAD-dependent oxidoreductase [Bacilli bacterium]